jgi:hypothetical protein
MRTLLFLGILAVIGLVVTGAIKMQRSGETINIQIDKQRVSQDAERVIDEGKEVLHEAESSLNQGNSRN